jgi:hypothetical protein
MATSGLITVTAPPSTPEVSQQVLAAMASQSGITTDYNKGSQIRTLSEALGSVEEISGISAIAVALQVIAYSGMSLFDITPNAAVPASGVITFATALLNPPPAVTNVVIASGTLMQTVGGVQFATTTGVTLLAGATGIAVPIQAVNGGYNTNVPASAIVQLLSNVVFPLTIYNLSPTGGGVDAETPTQALQRLAAKFLSLIGGSPTSVANSAIGVVAPGTGETVVYSTCYEGWADPNSPNYPNTPGFVLFVDNGTGSASSALLAACNSVLIGNLNTNTPGYHAAGMPYGVSGVIPVYANVLVSGQLGPLSNQSQLTTSISGAIQSYFTLPFNTPASQPVLAAAVANAALGQLSSLTVSLMYASASATVVQTVSGAPYTRVILNNMNLLLAPFIN